MPTVAEPLAALSPELAEALNWYRLAAAQGDASAQFNLGQLYYKGEGVPQDYAEALKWLRLAAEQGQVSAQGHLAAMYGTGQGVPQDYVQSHKWLNLAASRSADEEREEYVKVRDLIAKDLTPEQIAEAQRLAREWKPKTWAQLKSQLD